MLHHLLQLPLASVSLPISTRPPALIDINWAPPGVADADKLPLLALVGKGVVFDTGGLNLKTAAGMRVCDDGVAGESDLLPNPSSSSMSARTVACSHTTEHAFSTQP